MRLPSPLWEGASGLLPLPGAASAEPVYVLSLASDGNVKFFYDPKSHWSTSNRNAVVVTAPGSFQSELGCPAGNPAGNLPFNDDWQPECLRSWLKDIDGDGLYTLSTVLTPKQVRRRRVWRLRQRPGRGR